MKPESRRRKRLSWSVLVASWLAVPQAGPAAEEASATLNRDRADNAACRVNLNFIFEAIQEYRKEYGGRLPDKLSDLVPEFIRDAKTLVCPYIQKTGGLRDWRKEIRDLDFDPLTSYGYEFPRKEMGDDLWRGLPKRTWRDYKERQVEKLGQLGSMVPIVRCHFHRPRLNLAFDGHIYESELYWEKNFQQVVPEEELSPASLFADPAGRKKLAAHDFPPRDARASLRLLDLAEHYNGRLIDSWQGFPSNHLARLPAGLQEFGGVPFDVRGVIQLRAAEHDLPFSFPDKVEGIQVNQKVSRIHFLLGTAFDPTRLRPPQTNIGVYVVHYADNQTREIPILYGKQVVDCWFDPSKSSEPTEAKVAWTGVNEAAAAYGKALRICQTSWENPLRDREVASLSLFSSETVSAPFVIAITIDP